MSKVITATALDAALAEAVDNSYGDARIEVLPAYSGRGMYGSTCLGVVLDNSTDLGVLGHVLGLGRPALDSMGRSAVGYWPGVTLEGVSAHQEQDEEGVTCDNCDDVSESGWGDTPLCVDCQREEDPSLVCDEHERTFEDECPLDHALASV